MKLAHKLWPTNKLLSHRNNRNDSRCFRCNRLYETWHHVFQCPSTSSKQHHSKALKNLRLYFQTLHLSKPMITIMIAGIQQWLLQHSPTFPLPGKPYTDIIFSLLQTAFLEQTQIGWDNFLAGRLSSSWFVAHDLYADNRNLPSHLYSSIIAPKLIRSLWNYSLCTWTQRNLDKFGHNLTAQKLQRSESLNHKINQFFHQRHLLSPQSIPIIYDISLPELLQETDTYKRQWIYNHQVLQKHHQEAMKRQQRQQQSLPSSQSPNNTPPSPYYSIFQAANRAYNATASTISQFFLPRRRNNQHSRNN